MKTVIIVQARMGSTRLPGKILKEVLGKPLLEYQVERIRWVKLADEIVIATTLNDTDRVIVDLCDRLAIPHFRGSEQDVLRRYMEAARAFDADVVVRLTSDCPIIDPEIVDRVIRYYFDHTLEFDYVSNTLSRTYPQGMDTEVFPFSVLEEAFQEATESYDREHVTPFIYRHDHRYRLCNVAYPENHSHHRWTVDTLDDYLLIRKIIEKLYPTNPRYGMREVLDLFEQNQDLSRIHAHREERY